MKEHRNDISHCAHYISRFLALPENWIYKVITNHEVYKPVFLTRHKENLSLYPFTPLYSLDDFGKIRQYFEILFFRLFGYFHFFKKICVANRIQILHAHFGYNGVKLVGLKKKLLVPLICSFYGDDAFAYPRKRWNLKKYRYLFKEVDKVLVLGPYMRDELINLGCPRAKIVIHHLGIDIDKVRFEKRIVKRNSKVRFLIVSSFVEKKGIDLAIRALSKFKKEFDYSLDIIGDGGLRSMILSEIESSGIKDRVVLHGYKPYDYFIKFAYECDVLIQASRTGRENNKEGTPMAIVDAMATGLAIISTIHSDIPEIVVDNEHGYLAIENDLKSLEDCIYKILENPDKIEDFGINGRRRVEAEFDAKKQTQKLEEYYVELIRNK